MTFNILIKILIKPNWGRFFFKGVYIFCLIKGPPFFEFSAATQSCVISISGVSVLYLSTFLHCPFIYPFVVIIVIVNDHIFQGLIYYLLIIFKILRNVFKTRHQSIYLVFLYRKMPSLSRMVFCANHQRAHRH